MSADSSATRIDEIRTRVEAATSGPWCNDGAEIYQGIEFEYHAEWIGETCRTDGDGGTADACFMAHARDDVPWLLTEVNRLTAERDALQQRLDAVSELCDREEHNAKRWEHPTPVPDWVPVVRRATRGGIAVARPATEQEIRSRVAADISRADFPSFADGEDPGLVMRTIRNNCKRIAEDGPDAPYYVPPPASTIRPAIAGPST